MCEHAAAAQEPEPVKAFGSAHAVTRPDSDASAASSSSARPETTPAARPVSARLLDAPGFLPAATFAAILAVWEISCRIFDIPSFVLPAPSRILGGFQAIETARWFGHVWGTLRVALIGYFASIVIAIPIAIALARSHVLSRAVYPILVIVQSTPVVAVAPIIIVALGSGDLPRVVITCLITFFPLVVSTTTGLIDAVFEETRRFFDLPEETKLQYEKSKVSKTNSGYEVLGGQVLEAGAPPDRKEGYYIGLELPETDPRVVAGRFNRGPNVWPAGLPRFEPTMPAYFEAMRRLSGRERYSMPYFYDGDADYEVVCIPTCLKPGEQPKYPPVTVKGHLMNTYRKSYG
ncbi:MAG: hypothetical protein Kow0026_07590 [Oricola sp.]